MNSPNLVCQIGGRTLEIAIPEDTPVFSQGSAGWGPNADSEAFKEAFFASLDNPLHFPPLTQAILADDHVAIALEDGVPEGMKVATYLVEYLVKNGVKVDNIKLVLDSSHRSRLDQSAKEFQKVGLGCVETLLHDPHDMDKHAYVAASKSGDPIYVHRNLIDADVLLPIYCARSVESPKASDLFAIAPNFTDGASQQRWGLSWLEDRETHQHEHEALSREIGWLAGTHFAIATVPTMQGEASDVIAGSPEDVYKAAIQGLEIDAHSTFDLVVAMVEGDANQQSWMSVARAASFAERHCNSNGRIVVCCDLKHATPGIRDLRSDETAEKANRRLVQSTLEDAFPASVLRAIASSRSLYLMSGLNSADVESFGLAYVGEGKDLEHLLSQTQSRCILRGAQF